MTKGLFSEREGERVGRERGRARGASGSPLRLEGNDNLYENPATCYISNYIPKNFVYTLDFDLLFPSLFQVGVWANKCNTKMTRPFKSPNLQRNFLVYIQLKNIRCFKDYDSLLEIGR